MDKNERKTLIFIEGPPESGKREWALSQRCPVLDRDAVKDKMNNSRHAILKRSLNSDGPCFFSDDDIAQCIVEIVAESLLFRVGHDTVIIDITNYQKNYASKWDSLGFNVIYQKFDGLKACPFCGGVVYLERANDGDSDLFDLLCFTSGCFMQNGIGKYFERQELIKRWNMRTV